MRIVFWGTYDTGKPRNRVLLQGFKEIEADLIECQAHVWRDVALKTDLQRWPARLRYIGRWLFAYPGLVARYLFLPKHDLVIVGYLGHLDVLVLWPFAKLRGVPVIWLPDFPLFNEFVDEREKFSAKHPMGLLFFAWDWLACRATDLVLTNTKAGARHFVECYGIPEERTDNLFIGAETKIFPQRPLLTGGGDPNRPLRILFYGTFIRLHGIETIIRAARLLKDEAIDWTIIGHGQYAPPIKAMLESEPLPRLAWIPWVPYDELVKWIHDADICVATVGRTRQAQWALPQKVYQLVASGVPIIVFDRPGIRELLHGDRPGVYRVPAEDPQAIVDAIEKFSGERSRLEKQPLHRDLIERIEPRAIAQRFLELASALLSSRRRKEGPGGH